MVINTPFAHANPGFRTARSQITPAGQGDDSYLRLTVGRKVIYLSLLMSALLLVSLLLLLSVSFAGYTMDVEQAHSTIEESLIPHKDFGFLVVPKRLRYSAAHPFYFGLWSKLVFGSGCAFS